MFSVFFHFLLESSSVFCTCSNLHINELDIASFHILLELFFLLVVCSLQIRILDNDGRVNDRRIGNCSKQQV